MIITLFGGSGILDWTTGMTFESKFNPKKIKWLGQTNKMISFSGPPAPIFGGRIQIFLSRDPEETGSAWLR